MVCGKSSCLVMICSYQILRYGRYRDTAVNIHDGYETKRKHFLFIIGAQFYYTAT